MSGSSGGTPVLQQLQGSSVATISVSPVVTTTSQVIVQANYKRLGLIIYNNSANSGYIAYGSAANSSNNMTAIIPTFTQWVMTYPVYYGPIHAIRNAGTGTFLITELT